jgi:hypothetical protein
MKDGKHVIARVADSHMPKCIMESEVRSLSFLFLGFGGDLLLNCETLNPGSICAKQIATIKWVQEHTSIPVPQILAYELDNSHQLGAHIFLEKARFCFSALSCL